MPILTTMGLKKIFVAPAKNDGTMPANNAATAKDTDWVDLGDVYKDTCQLVDDDVEETLHESETSNKKINLCGEYVTAVNLTLMDPDLALLARYFGGTVTGTAGSRKWIRPRKPQYKEWAIWLMPEEGIFVGCPVARIIPKFEITYSSKGICLVPMKIKLQEELIFDESQTTPLHTT